MARAWWLPLLGLGAWAVGAGAGLWWHATAPVSVEPGRVRVTEARPATLEPPGTSGQAIMQLWSGPDTPAAGARVLFVGEDAREEVRADATGRVRAPEEARWALVAWPGQVQTVHPVTKGGALQAAWPGQIAGQLRDEEGAPVAGAQVALLDPVLGLRSTENEEGRALRGLLPETQGRTNADGSFSLRAPRAGLVSVEVRAPGFAPFASEAFQVAHGARRELRVIPPAPARGALRVVDHQGRPLANAELSGPGLQARADARGYVSLQGASARAFVRVEAPGFAPLLVEAAPGEIVLGRAARVEGQVEGAQRGDTVLLLPRPPEDHTGPVGATQPLAARNFAAEVAAGEYDLVLVRAAGEVTLRTISVREGERVALGALEAPPAPALACEVGFAPDLPARLSARGYELSAARGPALEGDLIVTIDGQEPSAAWIGPRSTEAQLELLRPATQERVFVRAPRLSRQSRCALDD